MGSGCVPQEVQLETKQKNSPCPNSQPGQKKSPRKQKALAKKHTFQIKKYVRGFLQSILFKKLHPTVGRYPAPPEIYKALVNYGEFSISSTGAGFPSTTTMEAPWLLPQVAQLQLAHAPLRGTEELRGGIAGLIGLHGVGALELS